MKLLDPLQGALDSIGRLLIIAASGAAASAMVGALAEGAATSWVELWRAIGFGTFSLIYLTLALRPRRSPALWEIAFLNKLALTLAWLLLPTLPEAAEAGPVDAVLVVVTLVSYAMTAGWRSWQR